MYKEDEIKEFCSKINAKYFKVSSLSGDYVENAFNQIFKEVFVTFVK